jgi:hypothetical protein
MTIPVQAQRIVSVARLLFGRWLPTKEEDFIVVDDGELSLKLWWEMSCTHWAEKDASELPGCLNVPVHLVKADVLAKGVPDELAEYLVQSGNKGAFLPDSPLKQQSVALGKRVHGLALTYFNRLVAYVRTHLGQYWLEEYPIDSDRIASDFAGFNAMLKVDASDWCRFRPTDEHRMTITMMDESRYIREPDWPRAKEFVKSLQRTSLVLELLSNAELFAGTDHRRAALVEAVTGLEVAISDFAKRPKAQEAFGPLLAERLDTPSLKAQVNHLGLSGSIRYLLPVIFPQQKLPTDLLRGCQRAVEERVNVVHYGQRDVPKDKLATYLDSIRKVCSILGKYEEMDAK